MKMDCRGDVMSGPKKTRRTIQGDAADGVVAVGLATGPSFEYLMDFLDDVFRAKAQTREAIADQSLGRSLSSKEQKELDLAVRKAQDAEAKIEARAKKIFDAYVKKLLTST
jgi:hypothetical protein